MWRVVPQRSIHTSLFTPTQNNRPMAEQEPKILSGATFLRAMVKRSLLDTGKAKEDNNKETGKRTEDRHRLRNPQ